MAWETHSSVEIRAGKKGRKEGKEGKETEEAASIGMGDTFCRDKGKEEEGESGRKAERRKERRMVA